MNTKKPADTNTYDTRAHAHRVPSTPKLWGAWEANRAVSGRMRGVVGESWPRTALGNIAVLHRLLSMLWKAGMAGDKKQWWWW